MSSLWNSSSAESGILRKNDTKDKLEDLLVFGYACKLFRDDHKALEIDQGKHLIPWMGENSLKIDRYDGRGALSDLKPFEASKEGYDATRWLGLSESERKIEQLCDEERYFALHTNEDEDELYKEEELKRLQTNQIHYNYDEKSDENAGNKTDTPLPPEEDDEPFVAAPGLDVPVNMILPKTVKQNARIEKTASFISKQGPQMEILLKTKQSGNPQFSFLNQDDPLYRYYRHILMAIKTGRYQIQEEQTKTEENEKAEEDHYLHPSLAPVALHQPVLSAPIIPQINYKPSANCAYSQLINKIKGNHQQQSTPSPPQQPAQQPPPLPQVIVEQAPATTTDHLQQYYQLQFYQQYGYWPQIDQVQVQAQAPPPPLPPTVQYVAPVPTPPTPQIKDDPYAQIVSNVSKTKPEEEPPKEDETVDITIQQPSLFSLAQYSGSESDDNEDEDAPDAQAQAVVIPPADVQVIVDKMASYVAKNGIDFENIVKAKGDPRFIFLEVKHLYNPYYKTKLKEYQDKDNPKAPATDEVEVKPEKKQIKSKEKKIITPVSFSIKKHSIEAQQVPRDKSALPVEDSTDDEEKINQEEQPHPEQEDNPSIVPETNDEPTKAAIIEIEDPIMELIDLTEDLEEKRDRRAEDRVKDKLALAAREKLAAKNRALQLERKKRAAAFLSQLKPQSSTNSCKQENEEIQTEEPLINEEYSRLIYHIETEKFSNNEAQRTVEKRPRSRSRSRSRNRNKSSKHQHQRKSHKRSHSHSRKRKREKRSHERKKSKRRHHSRSRSASKHRKHEKKDVLADIENKHRKTEQLSVSSSDYESDDYPTNTIK